MTENNDAVNMGTYNFISSSESGVGHMIADVIPYLAWGNDPNDPSSISARLGWLAEATIIKIVWKILETSEPIYDYLGDDCK